MSCFSGANLRKCFSKRHAPKHIGCMHLALPCLAHLASHRPRSPCLHQQQQQRRSAPPGRLQRQPGCCCMVQARRARPIRGEVGQARQGQVRQPGLPWPWAHYLALGPLYGGSLGPSWAHGIYMGVLLAPNHFENFFRLRYQAMVHAVVGLKP